MKVQVRPRGPSSVKLKFYPGVKGNKGIQGSLWHSGTGAPSAAAYRVGDWYLNDANGDVYEKTADTTWTLRDNLTGPQGPQGIQGIQGIQGPAGPSLPDGDKGDITVSGGGTTFTIDAGAVSNSKLADVATGTIKGRASAGTGSPGDLTGAQAAAIIAQAAGPLSGFRNRIINGNFPVNQRAVSGTVTLAAGAYGHDRWKAGASGCTYTFATSGIDTTITITAGSLMQVVESVNVEGGVYALSWTGTATGRVALNGATTSGSYAAGPITTGTATGGQSITVEFTSGTLGKVQLEPNAVTAFERRPYQTELVFCQRYYWQKTAAIAGEDVCPAFAYGANTVHVTLRLPVKMRGAPTLNMAGVSAYGPTGTLVSATSFVSNSVSDEVAGFNLTMGASPWTAGQGTAFALTAVGNFISASVEL